MRGPRRRPAGSVQVSPPSGESPIAGYAGRSRVETPATATSAATTRLIPAPAAQPRTAATTGTGTSTSARTSSCSSPASACTAGPRIRRSRARRRERADVRADAEVRALPREQHGADVRLRRAQRGGHLAQLASKSRVPCRAALLTAQRSTRPVRVTTPFVGPRARGPTMSSQAEVPADDLLHDLGGAAVDRVTRASAYARAIGYSFM